MTASEWFCIVSLAFSAWMNGFVIGRGSVVKRGRELATQHETGESSTKKSVYLDLDKYQ